MTKLLKSKLKTFIKFLKNLPEILARNSFLTFLALLLISLILGVFIFYQYGILAKTSSGISQERKPLEFKTKTYQAILEEWQERNRRLSGIDIKEYPDPFYLMTPSQEEQLTE